MDVRCAKVASEADAWIIPFEDIALRAELPAPLREVARTALDSGAFVYAPGALKCFSCACGGRIVRMTFAGVAPWRSPADGRRVWLALADAFGAVVRSGAGSVNVMIDNAPSLLEPTILERLAGLPEYAAYRFDVHKHSASQNRLSRAVFVSRRDGLEPVVEEGRIDAAGTSLARSLVNERRNVLHPAGLAERAAELARQLVKDGLPVTERIYNEPEIEALGMKSFLAVAQGARKSAPPALIVLRYRGGETSDPVLAVVGKGVCFDSGGYSLKDDMHTMFDDMSGAAAALGAFQSAARRRLPMNLTVVIPACENMISDEAYVPGDIIESMSGRSIEIVNADAEGRLTLADAMTYALRVENAAALIDIASLTGAAAVALGRHSAAVMSESERFISVVRSAAELSCEKVWPLPCDEELKAQLETPFADLRNAVPSRPVAGGAIIAGLFLREFAEGRPWLHIDMAPVCYNSDCAPACSRGATGWGASLLYHLFKLLCSRHKNGE